MVDFSNLPKPIVVQRRGPAFVGQAICGAVEKCVANLLVVVPGMIGDAVKILSQRVDRPGPRLGNIIGQAGVRDLGGRADARETWTG